MPMSHRPGISFGPTHKGSYNPGHGYGWLGRGVDDFSKSEHTPVGIGSRQRWHSVTHMASGVPVFSGSSPKLTQPEIQQLKTLMINALGSTRGAAPTDQQSAAAKLLQRQLVNASASQRLSAMFTKVPVGQDKSDLERIMFLGPAAAAAAANAPMPFGGHKLTPAEQALQQYKSSGSGWGGGSGSPYPSGGGGGSPGFDASASVNVNIPQPSLPPPPSASAKGSISF